MIVRVKSLDREESFYRKRAAELEAEAARARSKADEIAAKRGLYEVLLKDSLGIVIVIPDYAPDEPARSIEVKVHRAENNATLGRMEP
jgi:hypothetical protein